MFKRQNVVDEHLAAAFATVLEAPPRKRSLRVSGLPYCPILDTVLPRESEQMDLNASLYTTMGTYCHEGLQYFMALGDHGADVWGGWECTVCKRKWEKYCFRPAPCCSEPLKYVEVSFQIGPLSGHCDLVVCYRTAKQRREYKEALEKSPDARTAGKWAALEFKTTGPELQKPKPQHVLQIRTYCEMLRVCYKIDVAAYAIVYVHRKDLKRTVFGPFSTKNSSAITSHWMWRAIKGFKAATAARKDASRSNLQKVVDQRPCRNREEYDSYMGRNYDHSTSTCPMLAACSTDDRACMRAIKSVLESGEIR